MGTYEGYDVSTFIFEKKRKKTIKMAINIAEEEKGDDKKMIVEVQEEW